MCARGTAIMMKVENLALKQTDLSASASASRVSDHVCISSRLYIDRKRRNAIHKPNSIDIEMHFYTFVLPQRWRHSHGLPLNGYKWIIVMHSARNAITYRATKQVPTTCVVCMQRLKMFKGDTSSERLPVAVARQETIYSCRSSALCCCHTDSGSLPHTHTLANRSHTLTSEYTLQLTEPHGILVRNELNTSTVNLLGRNLLK